MTGLSVTFVFSTSFNKAFVNVLSMLICLFVFTPVIYIIDGQFVSPYMAMSNAPHLTTDSDGGWSSLASFGVGFAVGSIASAWIARENGASMQQAFLWGLAGGLAGGAIGAGLNNLGSFAEMGLDLIPSKIPLKEGGHVATIIINNNANRGVGGKFGGHVAIGIDGRTQGFSNATTSRGNKRNLITDKDTWHAPGNFGPGNGLSQGDIRFDIPISDEQAELLAKEMGAVTLNPPNYSALGQRCASVAARVLRAGKVIGNGSKFHQESPYQLRKYLNRKFKQHKTYSSKTRRQERRENELQD
jgi:hypothetical protein